MRPLGGVAAILTLLTDLSSGLRVVGGSSCFSDSNIWDFLSPEAAVSWYFFCLLSFSTKWTHSQRQKHQKPMNCANGGKSIPRYGMNVGSEYASLIHFKSSVQQFSQIEIYLLKPPNSLSLKQTAVPQLLGFLQLSLYWNSAIADFHLLGRSASSCRSSLSPEDNKQTMKTLPWKPFFFFFLGQESDSWHMRHRARVSVCVCPVASNSGFSVSHAAPHHNNMSREESCAFYLRHVTRQKRRNKSGSFAFGTVSSQKHLSVLK